MRESRKIRSPNELKTPVKIFQFLDKQKGGGGEIDLPVQNLEYTEIYRMIHSKLIRGEKTRENEKYIKH